MRHKLPLTAGLIGALTAAPAAWATFAASTPVDTASYSTVALSPVGAPSAKTACQVWPLLAGKAKVDLAWTPTGPLGTTYSVYRRSGAGSAVQVAGGLSPLAIGYTDGNLALSTTYVYTVRTVAGPWHTSTGEITVKTPSLCL